jgi:hypothetical protein
MHMIIILIALCNFGLLGGKVGKWQRFLCRCSLYNQKLSALSKVSTPICLDWGWVYDILNWLLTDITPLPTNPTRAISMHQSNTIKVCLPFEIDRNYLKSLSKLTFVSFLWRPLCAKYLSRLLGVGWFWELVPSWILPVQEALGPLSMPCSSFYHRLKGACFWWGRISTVFVRWIRLHIPLK